MHRISTQAGEPDGSKIELVEQPPAPLIFLTSASTDISTISETLNLDTNKYWFNKIRAIGISELNHPSQVDHYLATTAKDSVLILVRLLGGKNHWSYGIEQLQIWSKEKKNRNIIIISGVIENELELHSLSTVSLTIVNHLAYLSRLGGMENFQSILKISKSIIYNQKINLELYKAIEIPDFIKWDCRNEKGNKIGVILYRSLFKANDTKFAIELNRQIRKHGLSPITIWVNSLKKESTQKEILNIFKEKSVKAVITTTSFSSTKSDEPDVAKQFWDILETPVFQLLISTTSYNSWKESYLGLNSIDLTLQVVMPEIDGRITTRPCAFKETSSTNNYLGTSIKSLSPYSELIDWVLQYINNWIKLNTLTNQNKKVTIILANYPVKNGRVANGVGLDTPESLFNIIKWLAEEGYNLGDSNLPKSSLQLINTLLNKRTNDPESFSKTPLDFLTLGEYLDYWKTLNKSLQNKIVKRWRQPSSSIELENKCFPIHGIRLGNICILLQPSRGYDHENISDLHSPDLPPPHRYIAQYLWMKTKFNTNAVIHLGKHGSVEWLPGKGVGLSTECFPHIVLPPLPNIYPFIVNDPGEGSQAKRRTQAVIIDHLTPPLARAGLYGELSKLESLLDEYYESKLVSPERTIIIREKIIQIVKVESIISLFKNSPNDKSDDEQIEEFIRHIDSYLCELKDTQIRAGLHIFGKLPIDNKLTELIVSISRAPSLNNKGLTQQISNLIGFDFDPWSDNESSEPSENDKKIFSQINYKVPRNNIEIIDYLEQQAFLVCQYLINSKHLSQELLVKEHLFNQKLLPLIKHSAANDYSSFIKKSIINPIHISVLFEKQSLIKALNGQRVSSGPSGAPSRGRLDVLPTGRNFYSVDIRSIPTETSWDLGKRSSIQILDLYKLENGDDLKNLAISLWATSTMRNGGEDISQILALMGIQPVWDYATKRVIDLEVIPLSVLNRPRVDILIRISGLFRDSFPQLIELLYLAQNRLSKLYEDEDLNPYIKREYNGEIKSRIFGSAPGSYGAGLQEMISNSAWDSKEDLVESYINWSKWVYKDESNPTLNKNELQTQMMKVQAVIQNQDNKEHDILDSDDYYQFHGGLSAAVEQFSGKRPLMLIGDHSRASRPRINLLRKEIDKVIRSRLLNPKWIEGMKSHGYKGAFEIGASVDYLFGYDATTGTVPDWCYSKILQTFLKDDNIRFLNSVNPWITRDIAERLLEASNRNLWQGAKETELEDLKCIVVTSESIIERFEK